MSWNLKYNLPKERPRTGVSLGIATEMMKNTAPAEIGSSSIWNERDLEKSLEGQRGTEAKHNKCCWINELVSGL